MRLTVVLPTFNAGRFLDEQVTSLLSQTMRDFELLVVDDGSTDGTARRLEAFARQDDRIRVLPATGNLGQRHRLLELSRAAAGDLIAVADQDDVWHPEKLALLLAGLRKGAMAFGTSRLIDGAGESLRRSIQDVMLPPPASDDRLTYLFPARVSAHAFVARRRLFNELVFARGHPFDWLQSLEAAFSDGIAFVPEAITYHRLHGGNQSNSSLAHQPGRVARLAPGQAKAFIARRLTERWLLTQRFEHLAFSTQVPGVVNAAFRRAFGLASEAWFSVSRPIRLRDQQSAQALIDTLAPVAGSDRDLLYAVKCINSMMYASSHPRNVARFVAAALR